VTGITICWSPQKCGRAEWLRLIGLLSVQALCGELAEAGNGSYQNKSGIEAYLGVVPATITKGHDATARDGSMHGGVPEESFDYHIVVALFDAATGERITGASVTAQVSNSGQSGPKKTLEPMWIANTISYGGYFVLNVPGSYTIAVTVRRTSDEQPVTLSFTYDRDRL
jgi:hypothetical protein